MTNLPDTVGDEESAAAQRSQDWKTARLVKAFEAPFWPADRVEHWIALQQPKLLGESWKAIRRYPSDSLHAALIETDPTRVMLRALQTGKLRAIKHGRELPRELWSGATGRIWPGDVRFRREDVLRLWPGKRSKQS